MSASLSPISNSSPSFIQTGPYLGNQYLEDTFLQILLKRILPIDVLNEITDDLICLGENVASTYLNHAKLCETYKPNLSQFDSFGNRIDKIITCENWKLLHKIAAKEGLISIVYENKYKHLSRIYQFSKLYLFNPSSGMVSCPLAMTDGAARFLTNYLDNSTDSLGRSTTNLNSISNESRNILKQARDNLITRDPSKFWTSGQWMTERGGGSDVSGGTCTTAKQINNENYELKGYKWFTSATDANMTLTLARLKPDGPLSCFYMPMRDNVGNMNGANIVRLKDKLGTRSLPTAEMDLINSKAILVSELNRGVAAISTLVNITRLHNAVSACGYMRRMTHLVRDYAHRRVVFGKKLSEHPLHLEILSRMEINTRACTLFTFDSVALLGKDECKVDVESGFLLRILTPLVKLFTAKLGVALTSEGLECFGGVGFCEDSFLPVILRDSQVLPIWEGTTNVLSFDLLRVLVNTPKSLKLFNDAILIRLKSFTPKESLLCSAIKTSLYKLVALLIPLVKSSTRTNYNVELQLKAREFAYSCSRIYVASLFYEHYLFTKNEVDFEVTQRWIDEVPLISETLFSNNSNRNFVSSIIALDLDENNKSRCCGDRNSSGTLRSKY